MDRNSMFAQQVLAVKTVQAEVRTAAQQLASVQAERDALAQTVAGLSTSYALALARVKLLEERQKTIRESWPYYSPPEADACSGGDDVSSVLDRAG